VVKKSNKLSTKKLKILADGSIYEGEWLDCKRHGRGVLLWADGSIYEGNWEKGQCHGLGRLIKSDTGDVYEG